MKKQRDYPSKFLIFLMLVTAPIVFCLIILAAIPYRLLGLFTRIQPANSKYFLLTGGKEKEELRRTG